MNMISREAALALVIDGFDYSDNGLDGLVTHVLTPNEDGTVTYAAYIPKESKK